MSKHVGAHHKKKIHKTTEYIQQESPTASIILNSSHKFNSRGKGDTPMDVTTGLADNEGTKRKSMGTKGTQSPPSKGAVPGPIETMQDFETLLEKTEYAEEDVNPEQLQAKLQHEVEEKCHEWIDKTIHRMLFNTAFLTLICALMTAFACYVFVQLPYYVYSHHVLNEIFCVSDKLMAKNGFSRDVGLHSVVPLHALVVVMYLTVLYIIYLFNYPKTSRSRYYARLTIIGILEMYMMLCAMSYMIDAGNIEFELDKFFKKDKAGLEGIPHEKGPVKLMILERSQEYFGCCGYRSLREWKEIDGEKYKDTWPLSCCDEKRSDIACYGPVKKIVVFFRRELDEEDLEKHENHRLYESTCFKKEQTLTLVVISLITFSTVIFILLSSWTAIVFFKLSHLVRIKGLEIRQHDQYIDFF